MAERDLINAFDDCIDRLNRGDTMESCVQAYPQYAVELRRMLLTGQAVQRVHIDPAEVRAAQARGRDRMRAALQRSTMTPPPSSRLLSFTRWVTLAAALMLVMGVFLGGAALAAESSLPGDPLYGLKRVTEDVRLSLSGSPQPLQEQFAQRRANEVRQLLAVHRAESVDFSGEVETIQGTEWQVAGLPLMVPEGTPGAAGTKVSDVVAVQARTMPDDRLVASQITLVKAGDGLPTSTPQATVPPSPTSTMTPTDTETVVPSPTPTITVTPSPTATGCAPTAPEGWVSYRVRAGDTLSHLATQTGLTLPQLMEVNCLTNTSLIVAGENLYLPFVPALPPTSAPAINPPTPTSGSSGEDQSIQNDSSSSGSSSGSDGSSDNSGHGSSDDGGDDHSGSSGSSGSGSSGGSDHSGED